MENLIKVIATKKTELDLQPFALPFAYKFTFTQKQSVDKGYWFTASGNAKIYVGDLNIETIGDIEADTYNNLINEMVNCKADALWNGNSDELVNGDLKLYSFNNSGLVEITNLPKILAALVSEWDSYHEYYGWKRL